MIHHKSSSWLVLLLLLAGPGGWTIGEGRAVELNHYLPAHVDVVLGAELAAFLEAPPVQKHLPGLMKKYGVAALLAVIDPYDANSKLDPWTIQLMKLVVLDEKTNRKHIDWVKGLAQRVQIAVNSGDVEERIFFAIEGKFQPARFKERMSWAGKNRTLGCTIRELKCGQREYYELALAEDEPVYVALADDHNLIASPVQSAIEDALRRVGARGWAVRDNLLAAAAKVPTDRQLWIVAAPEDSPTVKAFYGGARVGDNLDIDLTVEGVNPTRTRMIAAYFRDALTDASDFLKHAAVDLPAVRPLPDLLRKLQRREERDYVSLKLHLSGSEIEKLIREAQ